MKRNLQAIAITSVLLTATLSAADKITYEDDILPIFRNKCLKCHNADKMKADLDLSTYDAMMNGSGNGPVLAGGDPDESILYKAVAHLAKPTMPPKDKLPEKEIEIIKKWVEGGLLMNLGSKAVIAAKPKVSLALDPDSLGKRPEGPAPMPTDAFALDPYVRTARTGVSTAMAVSPWSPLIAIGGQRQVLLYNTDTLRVAGIIPFDEGFPHSLKFSANGKNLIIGGGRGANLGFSTVWDITKGERLMTVGDDLDAVLATDISPDQRFIAHGGPDRFLRIFSTETGELVHQIKKHTDWVTAVRFSTDGKYVASGDRNGGLHIWETEPGQRICSFGHGARVTGLEWATTNVVVSASMDGSSKIFNVDQARQLRSWSTHGGGAVSLARAMNGQLVTSGRNNRATLWNANGGKIRDFVFPGDIPAQAVPSHDAKRIIGSDWNGEVFVWNAADAKLIKRLSLNPQTMAEKYAAAEKDLAGKQTTATTAAAARKAITDNIAKANTQIAAFNKAIIDNTKAAATAKATHTNLITAKQKPAQTKATAAAKAVTTATTAKAAADKALTATNAEVKKSTATFAAADKAAKADAENADKKKATTTAKAALDKLIAEKQKPAQTKATAAAKALTTAQAAKTIADKALTNANAEVAKAAAASKAAGKAVTTATAAAKTGKAAQTKNIAAYNKQAPAAQTKLNAANAALAAAQKEAKELEVGKVYSDYFKARKILAEKKAAYAAVAADAKAASDATAAAQTELDTAKKTDLKAVKAQRAEAVKQAQANEATADNALSAAKAEITKEQVKVDAATKAIATAEAAHKTTLTNVEKAKADSTKAAANAKAARVKANAAMKTYDQLVTAKRGPAQAIMAALAKAQTQTAAASANTTKALAAINAEVSTANTIFQSADKAAKAAEAIAATAKAAMVKYTSDLAKQKTELVIKQKTQATAKTTHEGLIAKKQKPAEAKLAAMTKAAIDAPIAKAAADKALAAVNAEVKAALMAYLATETAAQSAETAAAKDTKLKANAIAQRKAADTAKAALDKLAAEKQKATRATVPKKDAAALAAPINKANAAKELAAAKAEVAKAAAAHQAAIKAAAAVQTAVNTTIANLTKSQADYKTKVASASTKRSASNASKSALDKMIAGKQKPAQAAQAAQAATATELAAAKAAGDKVLARVNTELAEAAKPTSAADTAAKAVEATAKTAAANVTKLTATVNTAKALIDTRRKETVTAQAVMAKMVTEKQKPMEANLAGMKKAVATAQTAHANVEKNHTAQMQQLTQTIATQGKTAEVKTAEATKLAAELAKEEDRLNELKSTYEKLKTAANGKPTKTAAK